MAVVWPSKNNFANGDVLTAANMNNIADTLNVFNPTGAAAGTVPTSNGSGGITYSATSGRTTLASGNITSNTFFDWTGISQNFTDLQLRLWNARFGAVVSGGLVFDCGGTAITSGTFDWWNNSAAPIGNVSFNGDSGTTTTFDIGWQDTTLNTSGNNYWEITFHNYATAVQIKMISWQGVFFNAGSAPIVLRGMAYANIGSAVGIDKIRFNPGQTFTSCNYVLYGVS